MRLISRGILIGLLALATLAGCLEPERNLPAVVEGSSGGTVLVRYRDGRKLRVLNDMNYDLEPDQKVKVVENCDGRLHVAAAYVKK